MKKKKKTEPVQPEPDRPVQLNRFPLNPLPFSRFLSFPIPLLLLPSSNPLKPYPVPRNPRPRTFSPCPSISFLLLSLPRHDSLSSSTPCFSKPRNRLPPRWPHPSHTTHHHHRLQPSIALHRPRTTSNRRPGWKLFEYLKGAGRHCQEGSSSLGN